MKHTESSETMHDKYMQKKTQENLYCLLKKYQLILKRCYVLHVTYMQTRNAHIHKRNDTSKMIKVCG